MKQRFGLKIERDNSPVRRYSGHFIVDRKNGVQFDCSKQHEMRLVVRMLNEAVGQGNYGYGMMESKKSWEKLSELVDEYTDSLQDPDTFDAVCNLIYYAEQEAIKDIVKKVRRLANREWRFPGALEDGRKFVAYYKILDFLDTLDGGEEFRCPDCAGGGSFWEGGVWHCDKCGYKTNIFSLKEEEK